MNRIRTVLGIALFFLLPGLNATAEDVSGCWQGNWCSSTTGHQGPLFATLTKIDENHYRADFSGRFFRIIPFRYSVVLTVAADGETTELAGQQHMGRRYGTFHYAASVSRCEFSAHYTSCKDSGTFQMTRVGQ